MRNTTEYRFDYLQVCPPRQRALPLAQEGHHPSSYATKHPFHSTAGPRPHHPLRLAPVQVRRAHLPAIRLRRRRHRFRCTNQLKFCCEKLSITTPQTLFSSWVPSSSPASAALAVLVSPLITSLSTPSHPSPHLLRCSAQRTRSYPSYPASFTPSCGGSMCFILL